MTTSTKMIVGCGYLGRRVATLWQLSGARVVVATRRPERVQGFVAEGFEARVMDVTQPGGFSKLPALDTLLFAVAFDPNSFSSRESVRVDGLRNVLDAVHTLSDRLIYISTTGVYAQGDHAWVDEGSPCEPQRDSGRHYLTAERRLQEHRWGARSVILRLAGIYGPRRIPYLDRLRSGQPLPVDVNGYLNLIHVDDAARVILASEHCELPNLFVVADGSPVLRGDYYQEVSRCLGREPTFCQPDPQSPQAQRARASKRIRNDKLITELNVRLQYPSYRAGLSAILGSSGERTS